MDDAATTHRRRWFGHGRTRALLAAGLLVGTGAVATSAYWTAGRTISGETLTSGAMHIDLANHVRVKPETYNWTAFNLSDLAAGTSKAAVLAVSNNSIGPLTFSYRVKGSATGTLANYLTVTVRRGGTVSGTTCTGGTLLGTAGTALGGSGFDQPAGADLAPAQSTGICVQVNASASAPGGLSANLTFTFPATQVH